MIKWEAVKLKVNMRVKKVLLKVEIKVILNVNFQS